MAHSYQLQSQLFRALSQAVRLRILNLRCGAKDQQL